MLYPFMFFNQTSHCWVVKISLADYSFADVQWMDDPAFPQSEDILEPSIDLIYARHTFSSEREALEFIRDWWSTRMDVCDLNHPNANTNADDAICQDQGIDRGMNG